MKGKENNGKDQEQLGSLERRQFIKGLGVSGALAFTGLPLIASSVPEKSSESAPNLGGLHPTCITARHSPSGSCDCL
jgi:hypothetical protein